MPGYILHLTAAKIAIEKCPQLKDTENHFLLGSLMPDTVKEKAASHFRNPKYKENMIEYPDLDLFRKKYEGLMQDKSCLGYYFHLYTDYKYFCEYLPGLIELWNEKNDVTVKREEVVWVFDKKRNKKISRELFFSDRYLYGDYTKLNRFLVEKYELPLELPMQIENPGIEEVEYENVKSVFAQLQGYMDVAAEESAHLCVFEAEDLLNFLEQIVEEFIKEYKEKYE